MTEYRAVVDHPLYDTACRITPEQVAACLGTSDKTIEDCRARFDNLLPFRGPLLVPPRDEV